MGGRKRAATEVSDWLYIMEEGQRAGGDPRVDERYKATVTAGALLMGPSTPSVLTADTS